jgi:serine/threonine protein kinase
MLKGQILEFDRRIIAWHRSNKTNKRLDEIPGVGLALATALVASVADPRAVIPYRPPRAVTVPAAIERAAASYPENLPSEPVRTLARRYLVMECLKSHPKGSVFLALDLKEQATCRYMVLKQGRPHCMADGHGRDIRDRLRHQAAIGRLLNKLPYAPEVGDYFEEVDGTGYLPFTLKEGQRFADFLAGVKGRRSWAELSAVERGRLLCALLQVAQVISDLHQRGVVHRDITDSNQLVGDEGIALLDFELASGPDVDTVPFTLGSPGFMSPEQEARGAPDPADDVYAFCMLALLTITGIDPRKIAFASLSSRRRLLRFLRHDSLPELTHLLLAGIEKAAPDRPRMGDLCRALARALEMSSSSPRGQQIDMPPFWPGDLLSELVVGLVDGTAAGPVDGLWLSAEGNRPGEVPRIRVDLRCYPDAHRGVAGVVYVLSKLARQRRIQEAVRDRVRLAATWLCQQRPTLPGLFFGSAGLAVALAEACNAGLLELDGEILDAVAAWLCPQFDWPDITHGAAGQGLAALICANRLNSSDYEVLAHEAAAHLVKTQLVDGS